jgi:poly(A) polymerase
MRIFDRPPGPWIRPVKDHLLERVLDGDLASDDTETATRMAKSFVAANLASET